jgi:hypothetical protein
MPRFSEAGYDMYICQVCGRDLDSFIYPPQWRPELTGSSSAGNICPACFANMTHAIECRSCRKTFFVAVRREDYDKWRRGELIQKAMPYISADQRELFISQMCSTCFDELWA